MFTGISWKFMGLNDDPMGLNEYAWNIDSGYTWECKGM